MEQAIVSDIQLEAVEALIEARLIPDRPGVAARLFRPLASANIIVNFIVQNSSTQGHTDITFTVPRDDLETALEIAKAAVGPSNSANVEGTTDVVVLRCC